MSGRWTFEIRDRLPTGNQWQRYNPGKRIRLVGEWEWKVLMAVRRAGVPRATGRRRVTIERWSPGVADPAAPYATADKLVLDNLKARKQVQVGRKRVVVDGRPAWKKVMGWARGPGAIVDDNEQWIELMPIRQPRGPFKVVVTLEDLP